jgi:hypothetical protein
MRVLQYVAVRTTLTWSTSSITDAVVEKLDRSSTCSTRRCGNPPYAFPLYVLTHIHMYISVLVRSYRSRTVSAE